MKFSLPTDLWKFSPLKVYCYTVVTAQARFKRFTNGFSITLSPGPFPAFQYATLKSWEWAWGCNKADYNVHVSNVDSITAFKHIAIYSKLLESAIIDILLCMQDPKIDYWTFFRHTMLFISVFVCWYLAVSCTVSLYNTVYMWIWKCISWFRSQWKLWK